MNTGKLESLLDCLKKNFPDFQISKEDDTETMTPKIAIDNGENRIIIKFHKKTWDDNDSHDLILKFNTQQNIKFILSLFDNGDNTIFFEGNSFRVI